jgi:GT2 family glycosyltransferase
MVRFHALNDVPYMDDRYFLYFEEIDFMMSLTRCGWRIVHQPLAKVVHFAGTSTGISQGRAQSQPLPRYWYDSWLYYFRKNYGSIAATVAASVKLVGLSLSHLKRELLGQSNAGLPTPRVFASICLLRTKRSDAKEMK